MWESVPWAQKPHSEKQDFPRSGKGECETRTKRTEAGRSLRQVWPVPHRPGAEHSAFWRILPRPCAESPLSPPTSAAQQLIFISQYRIDPSVGFLSDHKNCHCWRLLVEREPYSVSPSTGRQLSSDGLLRLLLLTSLLLFLFRLDCWR